MSSNRVLPCVVLLLVAVLGLAAPFATSTFLVARRRSPRWHDPAFEASRASATRAPDGSWVVTVSVLDHEGGWEELRLKGAYASRTIADRSGVAATTSDEPARVPAGGRFLLTFALPPLDAPEPILTVELTAWKTNHGANARLRVPLVGELPADKVLSASRPTRGEFHMTLAGVERRPDGSTRVAVSVAPIQSWALVRVKDAFVHARVGGARLPVTVEPLAPDATKAPPFEVGFLVDPRAAGLEGAMLRFEIDTLREDGSFQMDERVDVLLEVPR